jgi:hypothetical protein
LSAACLAARAAEPFQLTGLIALGAEQIALLKDTRTGYGFSLPLGKSSEGWKLEAMDIPDGWASFQSGTNRLRLSLHSTNSQTTSFSRQSSPAIPLAVASSQPTTSATASLALPAAEPSSVLPGTAQGTLIESAATSTDTAESNATPTPPRPTLAEEAEKKADTLIPLLQQILNTPPPEMGSKVATGLELRELRMLWRSQTDTSIKYRLQQELDGYAARPIALYQRTEDGTWVEPKK